PASVRQCWACDRDLARDRDAEARPRRVRRHRQCRMAGADAMSVHRQADRAGPAGLRDLARWRPQCRRRPRRGGGIRRSRGAGGGARRGVVMGGMMEKKKANPFPAISGGPPRHIMAVQIPDQDKAMPPELLADAARALGMRVEIAGTVEAALRSIAKLAYEV